MLFAYAGALIADPLDELLGKEDILAVAEKRAGQKKKADASWAVMEPLGAC